ncbi:MAG TPA: hypothetical protein VHB99_19330 [Pirellulales bacterium]|nr:hypothetical protein [Pirellulales bacterium]
MKADLPARRRSGSLSIDQAAAITVELAQARRRHRQHVGSLIRAARRQFPPDAYRTWLIAAFGIRRNRRARKSAL